MTHEARNHPPEGDLAPWLLVGLQLLLVLLMALGSAATKAQTEVDPPGRVGRVAALSGQVWLFDLEEGRWAEAQHNRPVTAGDRLSTARDARADLRIGSTTLQLSEGTEIELVRLDDERVRVQLHRGSVALRLRSREVAAETSFGTDEAWLQPQRGGLYRLDRQDDTTFAASWRGELRVEDGAGLELEAGRRLQLWREGSRNELRSRWMQPEDDAFAARVQREDHDDERTVSTAHVSREMTGWEELDRHGRWDQHPEYGAVWMPLSVRSDWAPYRHGRWAWIRPWGWTWIDEAPWGFAPFHYGRWVSWRERWTWVPGRYVPRPVFAPALVGWLDGPGVGIGIRIGGPSLSWVPLAPWELFRPHYRVSPGYHERVNSPDHKHWRPPHRHRDHHYGNQAVTGAVTVVPADVLRPRPPLLRVGRDEPHAPVIDRARERERDRERDRDRDRDRPRDRDRDVRRPPDEVRIAPPPPPVTPVVPMPTRPQPVQPQPPVVDRPTPPPPAPLQPPQTRPQPVQPAPIQPPPTRLAEPMPQRPPPAPPVPAVQPPPPTPPAPATPVTPPPPRAVPRAPAQVEPKPSPRERDKDAAKDEPKTKPGEARSQPR